MSAIALLLVLIAVALVFDFLNGFNESANVVATTIASRAMNTRGALLLSAGSGAPAQRAVQIPVA